MTRKKIYNANEAKIEKKAVVLDYEIFDALADESDSVKAQTLYLFKEYDKYFCENGGQKDFDIAKLPADVRMAFKCKKINIERYGTKWLAAVERNRKNGAKGGRPKKSVIEENEDYSENFMFEETLNNPVGKSETQKSPSKPNKGLKGLGLKDSGCSGLKGLGEVTGEDCTNCVKLVEKFVNGEIGIEFKNKLPQCAQGCRRLSLALKTKASSKSSLTPAACLAKEAPKINSFTKF